MRLRVLHLYLRFTLHVAMNNECDLAAIKTRWLFAVVIAVAIAISVLCTAVSVLRRKFKFNTNHTNENDIELDTL